MVGSTRCHQSTDDLISQPRCCYGSMWILRPSKTIQFHPKVIHCTPCSHVIVSYPLLYLSSALHCVTFKVAIHVRCDIYRTFDNTVCCIEITDICEILAVFPITCYHDICKRSRKYAIEDCHAFWIKRLPG